MQDPKYPQTHAETTIVLRVALDDVEHLRTMVREQLAGDHELIRDASDCSTDLVHVADAHARLAMIERLVPQVGGLYGSGFASSQI